MSKKGWLGFLICFLSYSSLYAANGGMQDRVQQINTTADQIAAQAQTNMNMQRQQLQQYLQSIKPAAANPVAAALPAQPIQQVAPAAQQPVVRPQPTTVQQPNITGYQQNNGNNGNKQWNYNY